MKKLKTLLPVILIIASTNAMGQNTQMSIWFIAPKVIDMPPSGIVSVSSITPVYGTAPAATATQVANGIYDQSGNLLFYIADNNIYDYNNNLMGTLNPVNLGAEIAIVPFGNNDNNCQRKFNIFYLNGGVFSQTLVSLCKTVVDMNDFSVTNQGVIDNLGVPQEFGALAAGSRIINGNRFLYYLGGSGTVGADYDGKIRKVVIHSDGTVTMQPQTTWVYPPQYPWPNAGSDVFSTELELSPDGSYLAWASWSMINPPGLPNQNRYHFIRLDPVTGDYMPNSYTEFNIPNISGNNINGFRGIEFYQDGTVTKLFMGAGADGIFGISLPLTNFPPLASDFFFVFNSNLNDLGFSQIELSFNGLMYAASASGIVGAFDPTISFPAILSNPNSFTLINPLPPSGTWGSGSFFTLPDQIDGQDYTAIVPAAVAPVITVSSYTFSGSNATWSYGTNNNPWGTTVPIHILKELIIEAGSNLTISGMIFKFSPEARVIIKQGTAGQIAGGILTLTNNAVLTSAYKAECPALYTWKGVEVLGVKTASQHVQNNPMIQGRLIIKSNSRIEFAEYGARLGTNLQNAGGIVNASSSAVFYNCRTSVDFKPYQNFYISSGNTVNIGNRSSFYNTQFLCDEKFPFSPSAIRHVNIDNCSGIIFSTCTFHNNFSAQPQLYALNSFGIKSLNANFSVLNNSSFINLFRGIDARISSGNRNFIVTNSTFTDNQIGIFCDKVNNFGITGCTFFIGGNQKPGNNFHTGIHNKYGSGFTIEENTLLKSPNALANVSRWGILVLNTGDASNQIYKNTFSEMTIGNYASEQNRHPNNPFQGLQYLCNQNTGNIKYDFLILSPDDFPNDGIRKNQGTISSPARNTFSSGNTIPGNDINNSTNAIITYYYVQTGLQTPQYVINTVPYPIDVANTECPSNYCNNCLLEPLGNVEIQLIEEEYYDNETAYLNLLYAYHSLIDNGNTNALLNQIQQTWSTEAHVLRGELMELSPYLSEEILREVAVMNVLPPAMLLTVCLANPDATRSEGFIRFLETEIPEPLPAYMLHLIMASWEDATGRTGMENMLADYNARMAVLSDKLLKDLYLKSELDPDSLSFSDTTDYKTKIVYWLNRTQALSAKYSIAEHYISEQNYEDAETVIESIPSDFRMDDLQIQAYNDYIEYVNLRKWMVNGGIEISELDTASMEMLTALAFANENFARSMAANALCFYYDLCREEDYFLPSGSRLNISGHAPESLSFESTTFTEPVITVWPVPAADFVTFTYQLPTLDKFTLLITDITGKEIARFVLTEFSGKIIWETNRVNNGLYFYQLKGAGVAEKSRGKITVWK